MAHALFAEHAPAYIERGLPVIPVNRESKQPAIKQYQRVGLPGSRSLAEQARFANANLGVVLGERSGLTVVDVDSPDDNAIADALDRFGPTEIITRTPSGGAHLWYRHAGERRHIRADGDCIDILGSGYAMAPPSIRPDQGAAYTFLQGSLDDVEHLPAIRVELAEPANDAAPSAHVHDHELDAPAIVPEGEREVSLWKAMMCYARRRDLGVTADELLSYGRAWNARRCAPPLPDSAVAKQARGAMRKVEQGEVWIEGDDARVILRGSQLDDLLDAPYAAMLYSQLVRTWGNRSNGFPISPRAMAGTFPWGERRIRDARAVLLERGFIEMVRRGRGRGDPSLYRFAGKSGAQ